MVPPIREALDPLTGLPWSIDARDEAERLAADRAIHAILVWLSGLDHLVEVYGSRVAHTCLRHVVRRVAGHMDGRDCLNRHFASGLLIFTARTPEEVAELRSAIVRDIAAAALAVGDARAPQEHITVAPFGPVSGASATPPAFHELVLSLEATARQSGRPVPRAGGAGDAGWDARRHRVSLQMINVEMTGEGIAVSCALSLRGQQVTATRVGRNGEGARLSLVAEAVAQAIMKLLPADHVITVQSVRAAGRQHMDDGMAVTVDYATPAGRIVLQGIAPVRSDHYSSVARAVLNAVNRRMERAMTRIGVQ